MRRGLLANTGNVLPNPSRRSGCFSIASAPEDDGIIGNETFVPMWRGMREAGWLTDKIPAPSALVMPFYFHDMMPYNWS
jgi:hypothetical protein